MHFMQTGFKRVFAPMALCTLFAAPHALAGTTTIDFDHDASSSLLSGYYIFNSVSSPPLTTLYSALGVTFSGPAAGQGGVVMDKVKGYFTVPTHSGKNFLAFQQGAYASGPETLTFASPMVNVSIYAVAPGTSQFTMNAYNSANVLVGTTTATVVVSVDGSGNYVFPYALLSVNASPLGNISKVVLTQVSINPPNNTIYEYDDLSFTTASDSAVVAGTLNLQGISAGAVPQPITFTLRPTDGSATITKTVLVPATGTFTLGTVPRKNYVLHIKGPKYLAVNVNVNATGGNLFAVQATLPVGDINNDNVVSLADFGGLINVYGDSYNINDVNASAYDVAADLNGDGSVNSNDFGLLVNTYGDQGAL